MIGPDGRMNDNVPELVGPDAGGGGDDDPRLGAAERDLVEKREHYRHAVPLCERCEKHGSSR